jgi:hypothetical protein
MTLSILTLTVLCEVALWRLGLLTEVRRQP